MRSNGISIKNILRKGTIKKNKECLHKEAFKISFGGKYCPECRQNIKT